MPLDVPAVLSLERFTTMQTSRGCPWPCVFCDIPIFNEGKWRSRSPEHVLEEFKQLQKDGYGAVYFVDDHFLLQPQAHRGDLQGDRRRTASRSSGAARGASTPTCMQLFPAMAKAHCRTLMFGIESGSQKILDRLKKEQTLAEVETAVNERQEGGDRDRPRLLRRRQPGRDRGGHAADVPLRLEAPHRQLRLQPALRLPRDAALAGVREARPRERRRPTGTSTSSARRSTPRCCPAR